MAVDKLYCGSLHLPADQIPLEELPVVIDVIVKQEEEHPQDK
jgi:hypothetical protein